MSRKRTQQQTGTKGAGRRRDRVAWIVVALALAANLPVLGAGFVFDDHPIIEDNRRVTEWPLEGIWTTSYWGTPERVGEYRPLVLSTYALEWRTLGPEPGHFHAVNWLLHALVTLSVLFAGRAIGLGEIAAALGAGLFALHPIHLDAVAPIVGRAELLAALTVTGGTLAWIRARRYAELRLAALFGLAAIVAIGAFSKETALAVVPLLVAVEWLVVRRGAAAGTPLAASAAVALAIAGYLFARTAVLGALVPDGGSSFNTIANPLVDVSTGTRLLTAASILGRYLMLFAWPANLSPDYSFDSLPIYRSALDPAVWLPALMLALLIGLAIACLRRAPAIPVAVVAFLAPYSIVSNVAFPIGTMLAERLFYLPSIGLCWLVGAAVVVVTRRLAGPRLLSAGHWAALAALPGLALGAASFERALDWTDEEKVFRDAARLYPRNAAVWITLGELAIRSGHYPAALERMARVNQIAPEFAKAWLDRGTLLAAAGENETARDALKRALELEPENVLTLRNLAVVERARGDLDAARILDARASEIESKGRKRDRSPLFDPKLRP